MKNILIIRHAESIANTGERTHSHSEISLSEKGKMQAKKLAEELSIVPELIVISSYTRTYETALPFITKHPNVPVETWSVQEFTYLDTKTYNGTTAEERADARKKYWDALNIHYQDGENVETFYLFIVRIKDFLNKLKMRPEKNIVIFSHGIFIKNLKTCLEKFNAVDDSMNMIEKDAQEIMKIYKNSTAEKFPIENVSIYKISI